MHERERGGPSDQEGDGGHFPKQQCSFSADSMQEREGGTPDQEDKDPPPPKQLVQPAHVMQVKEGGGQLPEQRAIHVHSMQERDGWRTPDQVGERWGHPLSRSARPSCVV